MDYKDDSKWLMLGDCLERMKEIPDGSVDAVISDIPFGISFSEWDVLHKNTNSSLLGTSPAQSKSKLFKSRGKPLNGWSGADKNIGAEYREWAGRWLTEVVRITKACSPVLLMTGRQLSHQVISAAEGCGLVLKDTIYWDKTKAPLRAQRIDCVLAARGLQRDIEDGNIRLGNLAPRVEPIIYLFKPYPVGTTITDQYLATGLGCIDTTDLTTNLITHPSTVKEKFHETQKPTELFERLITLVTKNNMTVLDPFMGSGTTGVACVNTGRKFIGIEMDEGYYKIAQERIEKARIALV